MPHIEGDPTKPAPDCGLRGLELLDEVIRIIEERPETHDQRVWAIVSGLPHLGLPYGAELDDVDVPATCGSAMCVAGWAAHLTGARLIYRYGVRTIWGKTGPEEEFSADAIMCDAPGEDSPLMIPDYARNVLGIDEDVASELFNPDRTLDEIIYIRDRLWRGAPVGGV